MLYLPITWNQCEQWFRQFNKIDKLTAPFEQHISVGSFLEFEYFAIPTNCIQLSTSSF